MYILAQWKKEDPVARWNLPDRIFFGHGACHILSGVFLQRYPEWQLEARWLQPNGEYPGNHVFVTDGRIAFDYHGYTVLERLIRHHTNAWQRQHVGWSAKMVRVDFRLLDTADLNAKNMRGPNQYHGDVIGRAHRYLDQIDHDRLQARVELLLDDRQTT